MSDYLQMWKDLDLDVETHDLLCQVLRTLLDRFSPVLVDIQRPILVHILERKSIVLDDLYAGSL